MPDMLTSGSGADPETPRLRELVRPRSMIRSAGSRAEPAECCGLLRNLGSPDPRRRYRRVREIARGGSARIYEVWDVNLGRLVAMKTSEVRVDGSADICLHRSENPLIARFVGEAAIMCHLSHPGIVPVHEIGLDHDRRLYFTMGLVSGATFSSVIREVGRRDGDWSLARALGVLVSVCDTLSFAHGRGVVHRDLKPSNIMVGGHGQVFVMDWGLSHVSATGPVHDASMPACLPPARVVLQHAEMQATPDGVTLGTPRYMPLEQAEGRLPATHSPAVDVYGTGAVLYELLTGHAPYEEVTTMDALVAALRSRPTPPLPETVSSRLGAICAKAMASDPDDRYPGTDGMARDLRAWMERRAEQPGESLGRPGEDEPRDG